LKEQNSDITAETQQDSQVVGGEKKPFKQDEAEKGEEENKSSIFDPNFDGNEELENQDNKHKTKTVELDNADSTEFEGGENVGNENDAAIKESQKNLKDNKTMSKQDIEKITKAQKEEEKRKKMKGADVKKGEENGRPRSHSAADREPIRFGSKEEFKAALKKHEERKNNDKNNQNTSQSQQFSRSAGVEGDKYNGEKIKKHITEAASKTDAKQGSKSQNTTTNLTKGGVDKYKEKTQEALKNVNSPYNAAKNCKLSQTEKGELAMKNLKDSMQKSNNNSQKNNNIDVSSISSFKSSNSSQNSSQNR